MFEFTEKMMKDLFYEEETLSLTRVIGCGGYILFGIVSIYLIYTESHWGSYEIFSSWSAGTASALLFGNKFVDSKYNSKPGGFDTVDKDKLSTLSSQLDRINSTIATATNKYDELVQDAYKVSETIDNAKESFNHVKEEAVQVKDSFFNKKSKK